MNPIRPLDSFGEFHSAFHENRAVFIHHQFDLLRVGDFSTLEEIARATFKMPIISVFVPPFDRSKPLRFVVVTEDHFAHLIVLNNGKFRILSSAELDERTVMLCHTLLVDQQGRPHLLFENGILVRLSRNDTATFNINWPPPYVLRVVRMCSLQNSSISSLTTLNNMNNGVPSLSVSTTLFAFDNQLQMWPNSAAFSAYIRTENSCQITTWFLDFNENKVYSGPATISVSYQSQYISPFFFKQEDQIYSTFPTHEVVGDKIDDIVTSSNYYNGVTYFSTNQGEIYSLSSSSINLSSISTFSDSYGENNSNSDSDSDSDSNSDNYSFSSDNDNQVQSRRSSMKSTKSRSRTMSSISSGKRKSSALKLICTLKNDSNQPPIRIETNGIDFIYLNTDGTLISPKCGVSFPIPHYFNLVEYNSIMIRCGLSTINPFPTVPPPPPQLPFCKIENDKVIAGQSVWKPPSRIVASNTSLHGKGNGEYIIVATTASIHILTYANCDLKLLFEKTWESAITAVAISSTNYAVASIDNRVYVASFVGEPYSFTFQQSLCLSLSLSETTLASGFTDGLFILASLKDRGPIFTINPFKSPVKRVNHVDEETTIVEWGEATGIVTSSENVDWIKLPSFPGATCAAFSSGLLALGTSTSLDIYNFVMRKLIARIPIRVIGVCSSGNRFFALTIRNELIVLYFHREITVDHQSIIDVDEPLTIAAVDETVYVLCSKFISVFDMRGHKLDTVEIQNPPRSFGAASRGLFVAFSRNIWYISRDQSTKKIPHEKGNITGFAVIDDDRFVISTNSRLLICFCEGLKVVFSTITKIPKKVNALKCFNSKIDGQIDTILVIFDDLSIQKFPIPRQQRQQHLLNKDDDNNGE